MINKLDRVFMVGAVLLSLLLHRAAAQGPASAKKEEKREKQAAKKERINQLIKQEEEGALIYEKQNIYGGRLYNDGWGVFYEKGIHKTVNVTNLFSLEIGERKSPKEQRITKTNGTGFFLNRPLIYGKQNNFYFMKLGVGQSYLIGGKGNRNGVAVSAVYAGGVSLGLLKPYYVDITDPLNRADNSIRWQGNNSRNDSLFLDPAALEGGSGVLKGFGEIKIRPGLHARGALRFDYGRYNEFISAIEAGINVEYYLSKMPIMLLNEERRFFANVFIAFDFGRRK
ncbi:MAG: hypothetical protein EAY75_12345 [Bacteroidetes bacterium]|nr:MAG: hypothetical protein EAY75_12345 [Bacteroidota bacterium]